MDDIEKMLKQLKAGLRKQNTKGASGKSKFAKAKAEAKAERAKKDKKNAAAKKRRAAKKTSTKDK